MAAILLKTLVFTLVMPGTVTVLVPRLLLASGYNPLPITLGSFRLAGLLPILLGALVYLWCAWDFARAGRGTPAPTDAPQSLVARGLYRIVRNPMYVGVLLVLLGEAALFESTLLAAYAALVFGCFHVFVLAYEEPTLRRKFGESYREYCRAVPRWLPRPVIRG